MKKLSLYIFLVLMWCNFSNAETYDQLETRAIKKLQNEYLSCYAFYSISESVFKDTEDESLKYIIEQKDSVLQNAMDIEFSLLSLMGEELLDDEKLFKEKIEPQLEEVFKQLWEQWQNDSKKSLVSERNKFCQEILNSPRPRIEYWIQKLQK
jgi:hypothetical protein|tara:strand:- start:17 stop:472 length:456 start_codon:yes stop_codon:yes gene_type:complete